MSESKASIVISTFSTEESAANIGRRLVEQGLCACVSFTPIRSIYAWKGRVEDQSEWIALFKVAGGSATALKDELAKLHPFDVPEILEIKLDNVSGPYLEWLERISSHSVSEDRNHPAKRGNP